MDARETSELRAERQRGRGPPADRGDRARCRAATADGPLAL